MFDTITPKTLARVTLGHLLNRTHPVLTEVDSHRLAEALVGKG